MFESAVARLLNQLLGKYVQDLDTENLNVGIISGSVDLADLQLKPEALYELELPIEVKIGTIGRVNLQIPWSSLFAQPVIINIEDVLVLVGPAIGSNNEREKRLQRAAKKKKIQDLEDSIDPDERGNFIQKLLSAVVNNVQIYVRNVHIRYEDSISSRDGPLACGFCLQSLSFETTNSKWKPATTPANASTVYQLIVIEAPALYLTPKCTVWADTQAANISPVHYYTWKHYMSTARGKLTRDRPLLTIVKPSHCKIKIIVQGLDSPRCTLLVDAVVPGVAVDVNRSQLLAAITLCRSLAYFTRARKFRKIHPLCPVRNNYRLWWWFAYACVRIQRINPYTWRQIRRHRLHLKKYQKLYKSHLRSPNDSELKLDLQQSEDKLSVTSIVIAREKAKIELLSSAPDTIRVIPSKDPSKPPTLIARKTTFLSGIEWKLSSQERESIAKWLRIGPEKKDTQCKLNLTIGTTSVMFHDEGKEVLSLMLTQFLGSMECKTNSQGYKLSARIETILVSGLTRDPLGDFPVFLLRCGRANSEEPSIAIDFEKEMGKRPSRSLSIKGRHILVQFEPVSLQELMGFFQYMPMTDMYMRDILYEKWQAATSAAVRAVKCMVDRSSAFTLNLDIKDLCFSVPEIRSIERPQFTLLLDLPYIRTSPELQPAVTRDSLCQATSMELEERIYDRFHAELGVQVLFCKWKSNWMESRKNVEADQHLLPLMKVQVVFSNSIMKDYKLLPKYKLNVSISGVKVCCAELLWRALELWRAPPLPAPAAAPVPLSHSTDFTDCRHLGPDYWTLDLLRPGPNLKELQEIRMLILETHFRKERPKATSTPPEPASTPPRLSSPPLPPDIESEVTARGLDLPGFQDNVSPNNNIQVLLRLVVGEIYIDVHRSSKSYICGSAKGLVVDLALLEYGPAIQMALQSLNIIDKQTSTENGKHLEVLKCDETEDDGIFNLLYRKVRADCPDFHTHFHSVEHSLVADVGAASLEINSDALRTAYNYLHYTFDKLRQSTEVDINKYILRGKKAIWTLLRSAEDPPVPQGATKFSYSLRVSSLKARLCEAVTGSGAICISLSGLESELVYRANSCMLFKLGLLMLSAQHASVSTLYNELIWPDEDKVLELKYVRNDPGCHGNGEVKPHGSLRLYLGRLHVVLLMSLVHQIQQFLEPLVWSPPSKVAAAIKNIIKDVKKNLRLHLGIELHAPVLLLPVKRDSPNLLVVNLGDIRIENLFKQVTEVSSGNPVIDNNILVTISDVTIARAATMLGGTVEVQGTILEPLSMKVDVRGGGGEGEGAVGAVRGAAHAGDAALALALLAEYRLYWGGPDGETPTGSVEEPSSSEENVQKLEEFLARGEPLRKVGSYSLTIDGLNFTLLEPPEVTSSPLRVPASPLASLVSGECVVRAECFSDGSRQCRAQLATLNITDCQARGGDRPQKIFSARSTNIPKVGILVHDPPLLELTYSRTGLGARAVDVSVDRASFALAPAFLYRVLMPIHHHIGDYITAACASSKSEDGLVNPGYNGDPRPRKHSAANNTGSTTQEEKPLTLSIRLCQPEIFYYAPLTTTESCTILLRTELLIDYTSHSNTENLVISLAGLQVMSKFTSKLRKFTPKVILRPCDVEYSMNYRGTDEGTKINWSISEVDLRLSATVFHAIHSIIEEVRQEYEATLNREPLKPTIQFEEDMWTAKMDLPTFSQQHLRLEATSAPTAPLHPEYFELRLPKAQVIYEMEEGGRLPVLMFKLQCSVSQQRARGAGGRNGWCWARAWASCRAPDGDWQPLLEPVTFKLFKATSKSLPINTYMDTATTQPDVSTKRRKKRKGFESETSADEGEYDSDFPHVSNSRGLKGGKDTDDESEGEGGLIDTLFSHVEQLFVDDSSDSDSEPDSSESSGSDVEKTSGKNEEKCVSFVEYSYNDEGLLRERNQDEVLSEHQDSIDSGLDIDSFYEFCSYYMLTTEEPVNFTLTTATLVTLNTIGDALKSRQEAVRRIVAADTSEVQLCNLIGPGSRVQLISRQELDLAGNDRIIATAYYEDSRPSTPGDPSEELQDSNDTNDEDNVADEWNCASEQEFPLSSGTPLEPRPVEPTPSDLYADVTALRLNIAIQDFDDLVVLVPRTCTKKLHVLHPSKNSTRYYLLVERESHYRTTKITVRSPLKLVNETPYPIEVYHKQCDLPSPTCATVNPFSIEARACVVSPAAGAAPPLHVAAHATLYLKPLCDQEYETSSQGLWWADLARDPSPRDLVCRSKDSGNTSILALRAVAHQEVFSTKVTRSIPNYTIRIIPPLSIQNCLPYALDIATDGFNARLEPGSSIEVHTVDVTKKNRFKIEMSCLGQVWNGAFTLTSETIDKPVKMSRPHVKSRARWSLSVLATRHEQCSLAIYAGYWIVNKTGLTVHGKMSGLDPGVELTTQPYLLPPSASAAALRLRVNLSRWSRRVAGHGPITAKHSERDTTYTVLTQITHSQLRPDLTKIITILPYYLIQNESRRLIRFMEDNESADLWLDLAPQQCMAFWPITNSLAMRVKFGDTGVPSQYFHIASNHMTVLRMDKGTALTVVVTGGDDSPYVVTLRPYCAGDAPVRVHNLCEDLFIKLHQAECSQVSLLRPAHSVLYTWDDPRLPKSLIWNVYNSKKQGYIAMCHQDGCGVEKISIHSVKQTQVATPTTSVASKLTSTFKRLTPKSPDPESSSSEGNTDLNDTESRKKKGTKIRTDKIMVYWVSYMEGHQRVITFTQDEYAAKYYQSKVNAVNSALEIYFSLPNISLSLCTDINTTMKELMYISVTDSKPIWEIYVSHKWRRLHPEFSKFLEDCHKTEQKICTLDQFHLDFDKMQMTKPFFGDLRRIYQPGVWTQVRKSENSTLYMNMKVNRLQIDNQFDDAIYPCVLYPNLLENDKKYKPSLELTFLRKYQQEIDKIDFKFFKVIIQEHTVNLERNFVDTILEISSKFTKDDPGSKIRADLYQIHMPLQVIAAKNQLPICSKRLIEYLHMSPLKLNVCLSGSAGDCYTKWPDVVESELKHYLYEWWQTNAAGVKEFTVKAPRFQVRNMRISIQDVLRYSQHHYWKHILRAYSRARGRCDHEEGYYDPLLDKLAKLEDVHVSGKLEAAVLSLLTHCGAEASLFGDSVLEAAHTYNSVPKFDNEKTSDIPECLLKHNEANIKKTAAFITRLATQSCGPTRVGSGADGPSHKLCTRRRLPRHIDTQNVREYCQYSAEGAALVRRVSSRGAPAAYLAHYGNMLLTHREIITLRGGGGEARAEWRVALDDLLGVPDVKGNTLCINFRQDELVNYFSTDEKIIEFPDAKVASWMQAKIECALISAMDEKRCPAKL